MDGQQQRQALSAAERSLNLAAQPDKLSDAVGAARKAEQLDQIGAFSGLAELLARLEGAGGAEREAVVAELRDVVGPGPLIALVDRLVR